ncbi:MAG: YdeI/OmpD-associated family protein [Anaerolineae bacterium]|nr:YdeI/OmpD-associated family protein [Gemmatimonadaceae bacterium]
MGKTDTRVDAYIARSAEFARPILAHLRKLVHAGCPDVEETLKWGVPHFMYKGMLCGMAAFKNHCAFGFWKGAMLLPDNSEAMGNFGRISALSDLPGDKILVALVKKAARSNDAGEKRPQAPRIAKKTPLVPAELAKALSKSPRAKATFESFSPSNKREYIEWIAEAKTDVTRTRRLVTAVEWMAEGKPHNWKYMKARPVGRKD